MSQPIRASAEPLNVRARSRCGADATVRLTYGRTVSMRLTPDAARKLAAELTLAADAGERITAAEVARNRAAG